MRPKTNFLAAWIVVDFVAIFCFFKYIQNLHSKLETTDLVTVTIFSISLLLLIVVPFIIYFPQYIAARKSIAELNSQLEYIKKRRNDYLHLCIDPNYSIEKANEILCDIATSAEVLATTAFNAIEQNVFCRITIIEIMQKSNYITSTVVISANRQKEKEQERIN